MIAGLALRLVSPPLALRQVPGAASERIARLVDELRALEPPGLVIAPAGLAAVETEGEALELAERVRAAARHSGTAICFGLDVGPPLPGAGRLFVCLGGAPVVWPAPSAGNFPTNAEARLIHLGGARLLPLFAAEALDPAAARQISRLGSIDAIVVLSHGGATQRWAPALARLERVAPLLVSTHYGGVGRGYASPQLGVSWSALPQVIPDQFPATLVRQRGDTG